MIFSPDKKDKKGDNCTDKKFSEMAGVKDAK